jgi:GTPase SAR1 family protein
MVDRIFSEDFVPSPQDVLHARVKTTGITEMCFSFGGLNFRIVDVGGQRSERKKWIHCFAGVTAILFVTSLSEYDQRCYEDNTTLRMKESLLLFDDMCNHRFFVDTPIILFLNKTDLFDSKISSGIDLKVCFPEYNGGLNTANAKKYIAEKFCELNRNPRKQIYTHFTCATDTDNIRYVFSAVKDIILQNSLRTAGLID